MKLNNKKQQESKEEVTMRHKTLNIVLLMAFTFLIVLAVSGTSLAANTLAGTTISNDVTVDYKVGGVDQTQIVLSAQSSAYTFVVDNKVDLTVVSTGNLLVVPGSTNQAVGFTVTNTGNSTQTYALARESDGTATFTMTSPTIYIDLGVVGTYEAGTDVAYADATTGGDVAPGGTLDVIIIADTPIAAANGQIDPQNLLATARAAVTGNALAEAVDTTAGVEIVFADEYLAGNPGDPTGPHSGDNVEEGTASAQSTYTVNSVTLIIAKSSVVISDPVNGTTNPIAIPGAVVRYTITVDHTAGASDATNITVSDDLSTEIGNGTIAYNTQHTGCAAGQGIILNINGGGNVCQTNASDSGTDDSEFTGNTVSSSAITLPNGQDAVVTFEVTIQ